MKIITLETKGRYVTVHPPPCAVIGRVGWGGATPRGLSRGVVCRGEQALSQHGAVILHSVHESIVRRPRAEKIRGAFSRCDVSLTDRYLGLF